MILVVSVLCAVPCMTASFSSFTRTCPNRLVAMAQLALPWWVGANAVVGIAAIVSASGRSLAFSLGSVAMGAVVMRRSRGTGVRLDSTRDCVPARTFTIEVANVFTDNRELFRAARQLVEREPDVLIVTELTAEARADILAVDNARYANPVHVEPIVGDYVVGIFTKDPAHDCVVRMVGDLRVTQASIMVGDLAVRVVGVHPDAPTTRAGFRRWKGQLRSLRGILDEASPLTVVAGDFNAGPVQSPFERLLGGPFSDAHRSRGRGLLPSWGRPTWMPRWFPPLVARLDHVLLGPGLEAVEVEELDAIGSDHRPLRDSQSAQRPLNGERAVGVWAEHRSGNSSMNSNTNERRHLSCGSSS